MSDASKVALAILIGAGLIAATQVRLYETTSVGKEYVYRTNLVTGAMAFCLPQGCQQILECRLETPAAEPEIVAKKGEDIFDEFERDAARKERMKPTRICR